MQLRQAIQGSKENTAGDGAREGEARLRILTSWAEIQLGVLWSVEPVFTYSHQLLPPALPQSASLQNRGNDSYLKALLRGLNGVI